MCDRRYAAESARIVIEFDHTVPIGDGLGVAAKRAEKIRMSSVKVERGRPQERVCGFALQFLLDQCQPPLDPLERQLRSAPPRSEVSPVVQDRPQRDDPATIGSVSQAAVNKLGRLAVRLFG